jgi:chitodextrinase
MSAARTPKRFALVSVASIVALALATSAGGVWSATKRDREAPSAPANVHVTSATPTSVSLAWDASTDNVGVAGYYVYVDAIRARVSGTSYTAQGLTCGTSVSVQVVAFDFARNRSGAGEATVATAACPDTQPPTAPDGFQQGATTQTDIVLEWKASSDNVGVVSYGIYHQGLPVDSTPAPAATLSGLDCGSTFRFDVDAADAAGNRSARSAAWVTTADCSDAEPPTAPTGLAVTGRTGTTLTLSWSPSTDNVGVAGYRVSLDGQTAADVTEKTTTLSGLECGTAYVISVAAYDAAGNRSPAATVAGETESCPNPPNPPSPPGTVPPSGPSDTSPPSQPTGLAVTAATRTSMSLTWAPATDNVSVSGYGVYVNGTNVLTTGQPGAMVSSLTCGTAYTLEVDAFDAAGNRSGRASVTASTSACADTQAPTPPANVVATSRTATSIALSWSASTDNVGVTGYGLYRGATQVGTSNGTTGIFSNLACNTNYTLAVDAFDVAANRSAKTTVMVSTAACADTTPPSTPTGLAASNVSKTDLTLAWNASSDNVGVVGYDVFRNGTLLTSVTSTSSAQTGLACGTSYWFGVEARDAAGNRSSRAQVNPTTAACSTPPTEWAFCANEGQQCTFSGTKDVRYGANGTFTAPRTFDSSVSCTNGVFGDPLPAISKHCEYRNASSPPPPPPPSGGALDDFSDFKNNVWTDMFLNRWRSPPSAHWTPPGYTGEAWPDGSGIFEVSTSHGPGFRFVQGEGVPRASGNGVQMADVDNLVDQQSYLGTVTDISGKVMFPASGNPSGFPAYGDWNCLWEFSEGVSVFNQFGIDAIANKLYVRSYDPSTQWTRKALAPSTLQYDRWYDWRWQIKWSRGSDGFVNFWIDGQLIAAWTGANLPANSQAPWLQWGWYGGTQPQRNEVLYAALTKS